jgi:hypothetical protein
MIIVVSFTAKWGKDLFYPESEDALFLTKFTGHPTLTKNQLKLAIDRGWDVKVLEKKFNLHEYLKENTHDLKE